MSGQLCLKWNNHSVAFSKLLNKIFLEDVYSDATILCHGKFYPVHCFVLSTCSEYFDEMFRQCIHLNNKHPFIIVKDINPEQMEALLNYMYKGEVNVPQEMLPELIKAAEAFKIKGLAVSDEEPTHRSKKRLHTSSPSSLAKKSKRLENKFSSSNVCDHSDNNSTHSDINDSSPKFVDETPEGLSESLITEVKKELDDEREPIQIIKQEQQDYQAFSDDEAANMNFIEYDTDINKFDADSNQYDEVQEASSWDIGDVVENEQAERLPTVESSISANKNFYRRNSNMGQIKACPFLPCTYKSRDCSNLRRHVRAHTTEKPYQCPKCSYRAHQKANVTSHLKNMHSLLFQEIKG